MLRAENKTGQDLCCANSIPKEQSSRTRQGWDIKPHTNTPHPALSASELHFSPPRPFPEPSPSPRGHLWDCQEISIISCHWEELEEEDCKGFQKDPIQVFHLSFPRFSFYCLPSKVCTICTAKHKGADGKLSTCLTAGNQRFILHPPLSLPSNTKHRPGLRTGSHKG